MNMSDLLKIGATAFINSKMSGNAGSGLDLSSLVSAISSLTGDSEKGGLDLGEIVNKMQNGNMGELVQSWLGDGENEPIEDNQVKEMFGSDRISEFASRLGLSQEEAVGGLRDALPQMVDKASSGGSLLDIDGISNVIDLASKFFRK